MYLSHKKAFSLLELTFVIVIIGILSAIAIPKLTATRDDAVISKARATVAAIRNSIAAERQKRILRGDFTAISTLHTTNNVFDVFSKDGNDAQNPVLEYPVANCATLGKTNECWKVSGTDYRFILPVGGNVDFEIVNNRFVCKTPNSDNCRLLTQ